MTIPGNSPYHAAKWAVGGFSDSLADEVAPFGVKVCTLEPGSIRTDFKRRASKRLPELLPEYEPSVGPTYKMMAAEHGGLASDPRKIADIVVRLSNTVDVPKRLLLGKDADAYVKQGETARAEEAAKYHDLTLSTWSSG